MHYWKIFTYHNRGGRIGGNERKQTQRETLSGVQEPQVENTFLHCSFFFFLNFLEDTNPFFGATDTPVSDFWWCLLWISKPEWVLPYLSLAEAYMLYYMFPEIHLWYDTCQPLGGQHGSWAVSSTYLWGIGGTQNWELSCHRSQCEIRQTLYRLSYPGSAFALFLVLSI